MSPPLTMLGMSGPVNTLSSAVAGEGGGTAQISFRYHMYGADMGTVYLYWESGGTYTLLWSKTGQQHSGQTYAWTLGDSSTTLDGRAGETGNFVFVYFKGANKGYRGDAAFCEISLSRSTGSTVNISASSFWRTTASNSSVSSLTSARSRSTSNSVPTNSNSTWCYDGGGPTPSSNTGPDKHHNNISYYDYIYFEASGSSSSANRYYTMRTANSYTL